MRMKVQALVPHHIAIVMDGNGRWATRRFLPRVAGHKAGVDALRRCVRACAVRGVSVLTVFAFSSENWNRPQDEVSGLMELLLIALSREVPQLVNDGVSLRFVGERTGLAAAVRTGLARAEEATASCNRLALNVCFNYGGRWDIVQAAQRLAAEGTAVTEESLGAAMQMGCSPDPDLMMRCLSMVARVRPLAGYCFGPESARRSCRNGARACGKRQSPHRVLLHQIPARACR